MDEAGGREELHDARAVEQDAVAQSSAEVASTAEAASGSAAPERATSPPVAAEPSAAPSSSSSSTTIGMFFAMDSVGNGDDAINIIEDGDHVTADDFGLGSTDISMNSMAATMAAGADLTHMGMSMELNALQIQAFLTRAERDASENATIMSSSVPEQAASSSTVLVAAQGQQNTNANMVGADASAESQSTPEQRQGANSNGDEQVNSSFAESQVPEVSTTASTTNAYDASRDVVFYSRREDKMKKIREHPIVDAVSADGRQVTCKCGRVVRLNPPWYILKYEQHIVSRNCTFLRKRPKTASSNSSNSINTTALVVPRVAVKTPQASPSETADSVALEAVGADNNGNENAPVAVSDSSEAVPGEQIEAPASGTGSEVLSRDAQDVTTGTANGGTDAPLPSTPAVSTADDANTVLPSPTGSNESKSDYALRPLHEVLVAAFGVAPDGSILPPSAASSSSPSSLSLETMPETTTESGGTEIEVAEHARQRQRQYDAALVLQSHPHFSRITPDGLIVECKCSKLIVLSGSWVISKFLEHVAEKSKTPSSKKKTPGYSATSGNNNSRRSTTSNSYAPSLRQNLSMSNKHKQRSFSSSAADNSGAAFRLKKKSFPSEIHWDVAQARNILPCPGLCDEKMNLFVESAVHLTGGARPRYKIAQELFPQLYPEPKSPAATPGEGEERSGGGGNDSSKNGRSGERLKISSHLSREEKLLLHDAIEAEALWFIDKDGNSVRSLDCRGMIDTARGESVCASCDELRSNVSLRTAATFTAKKAKTQRNPLNRKFCSSRVFSALEAEFNMDEEYARVLRDLSLADIADDSALNMWFDMAEMGINGDFDAHSALLGLVESMAALKDKERRGVGMQNMFYSERLDAFMRSVSEISPDACDFFQHHLCGRKQKVLQLSASGRKRKSQTSGMEALPPPASLEHHNTTSSYAAVSDSSNEGDRSAEEMHIDDEQQHQHQRQHQHHHHHHHHHHLLYDASSSLGQTEGFASLLDASSGSLMPSLSINDIQDVDLSSFTTSSHVDSERSEQQFLESSSSHHHQHQQQQDNRLAQEPGHESSSTAAENQHMTDEHPEDNDEFVDEQAGEDPSSSLATAEPTRVPPMENMPCTGLRDEKVQTFVKIAVQIIGGSRPKYVIAKELFPHVFGHEKTVKIVEKLNETQKQMLQDAVFSECLWRVDKVGNCVRSLRCQRFTDKKTSKSGVCRACRDLKSVPNFRSVLSRAKTPKNLENVKYMPSTYTESDPFLRKLSKNASFRALYQLVKLKGNDDKKKAVFWLKFARMGVFGNFRTHPVFEGLMESMVEVKDKERRGVGKQNMQYSKPLDDFMNAFSAISMEAFDLFASQFCGRTIRSQKVKKRKAMPSSASLSVYDSQSHSLHAAAVGSDLSGPMTGLHQQQHQSELHNSIIDMHQQQQLSSHHHHHLQSHHHHHHLMAADELLGGRSMTASDLEESQRFMDRMLDEVRGLSSHDIQQLHGDAGDSGAALEPRTYLDEEGVLTTEI